MSNRNKYFKISNCAKSVRMRRFFDPFFQAFGMYRERYGVSRRIQSACWKIRTRKNPNTYTFHLV